MLGHEYQDRVSLEMASRVVARLRRCPDLVQFARNNIRRWSERNHDAPGLLRCYSEWSAILDRPLDEVIAILTARTDEGQRLRQSSPFVGILSPSEVWDIKRETRARMERERASKSA